MVCGNSGSTFPDRVPSEITSRWVLHLACGGSGCSGNPAGVAPYKIGFNVEADVLVNIAAPYPNPFSHLINFIVVVSGNSAPEYLAIQLVDVNGKLLREISPADVIVGTNQWSWDGTDQYGNTLPKGVYICKTTVRMRGKDYGRTSKIVLLR